MVLRLCCKLLEEQSKGNEYTCDSIARKEHETINDHIKKAFVIKK